MPSFKENDEIIASYIRPNNTIKIFTYCVLSFDAEQKARGERIHFSNTWYPR